jgi:hypothetical protein
MSSTNGHTRLFEAPAATRRARVEAITNAATVRVALGQAARHRRLPSGEHQVSVSGRTATAKSLQGAIDRARAQAEAERGPDV